MTANNEKAIEKLKRLFQGNQHSWPDGMHIIVTAGQIREILALLGEARQEAGPSLGERKKEISSVKEEIFNAN